MFTTPFCYKRAFYYLIASVFTFINFLSFLISRSNAWVLNPGRTWQYASLTEFRDYPASEFERTISCYAIYSCQRIGSALIMQPLIFAADLISDLYFWNLTNEARIFNIQVIGLSWRAICVGSIAYVMFRLTKSAPLSLFYVNALLVTLSGALLSTLGAFTELLPISTSTEFKERQILAFQDFPNEQLIFYDYTNFLVLALIVLIGLSNYHALSFGKLLILGFVFTSLFEFYGFLLAMSLLVLNFFSEKQLDLKNSTKQIFAIALGSIFWLIAIMGYFKLMREIRPEFYAIHGSSLQTQGGSGDLFWAIKNPIENFTNNPSMHFQIFLVLLQSGSLGFIFGSLSRLFKMRVTVDNRVLKALLSVLIAHALVQFVTIFVTYGIIGMAGEHSRQTIGLQIALFTYVFLRTAIGKKTDRPVAPVLK